MQRNRIAIHLDDLGRDVRGAIRTAAKIGAGVIEIDGIHGPLSTAELSQTGRRELAHLIASNNLQLAAINAEPRGVGYLDPLRGDRAVRQTIDALLLARDMNARVVVSAVSTIAMPDEPTLARLRDVLQSLADHCDRIGPALAIAPKGPSMSWWIERIRAIGCRGVGVLVDTGHWIMSGVNPTDAIEAAGEWIRWVHVSDAVPGIGGARPGYETPLGEGALDAPSILATLDAAGYNGPVVLRQRVGDKPIDDLAEAIRSWTTR